MMHMMHYRGMQPFCQPLGVVKLHIVMSERSVKSKQQREGANVQDSGLGDIAIE
jgi:hypothetical protein